MKRLVVYYSLSGNTEAAARKLAEQLGADLLKLETVRPMPKSFAAQLFAGGAQVLFHRVPELKPLGRDAAAYDELILGTPIWSGKAVPAVNAFLRDERAAARVTSLFFLSGGGDTRKGLEAIAKLLPNLKHTVSLLDRKHKNSGENDAKLKQFAAAILEENP